MRAVDTNVLVSLLVRDDPAQVVEAETFVESGAWVLHVVLFETLWALDAVCARTAKQIAKAIELGEFVINANDSPAFEKAGLSHPTKFSLRKTVIIPYNSLWFCPPPSPPGAHSPKLGELHATSSKKLHAAFSGLTKAEQERLVTK